jgi:hypothetical protein
LSSSHATRSITQKQKLTILKTYDILRAVEGVFHPKMKYDLNAAHNIQSEIQRYRGETLIVPTERGVSAYAGLKAARLRQSSKVINHIQDG